MVPEPGGVFRDCVECPEMVMLPEGTFTMGSPSSDEGGRSDKRPRHAVRIDYSLAVGKYEVTVAEFRRFAAATGPGAGKSCWTFEW